MRYLGSKNRIAKDIIPIILKDVDDFAPWVEPFVGGFNMIDKVLDGRKRIGSDVNPFVTALFKALQQGWIPPDSLSEEEYADMRVHRDFYAPELVGFVGFGCTFASKFFGGYARGRDGKGGSINYALRAKNSLLEQIKNLMDVEIYNLSYADLPIPPQSVIYCDPPYADTTGYNNAIDHEHFWEWCRQKSSEGHHVFVSEYKAPDDFTSVWSREVSSGVNKGQRKSSVERLFTRL